MRTDKNIVLISTILHSAQDFLSSPTHITITFMSSSMMNMQTYQSSFVSAFQLVSALARCINKVETSKNVYIKSRDVETSLTAVFLLAF